MQISRYNQKLKDLERFLLYPTSSCNKVPSVSSSTSSSPLQPPMLLVTCYHLNPTLVAETTSQSSSQSDEEEKLLAPSSLLLLLCLLLASSLIALLDLLKSHSRIKELASNRNGQPHPSVPQALRGVNLAVPVFLRWLLCEETRNAIVRSTTTIRVRFGHCRTTTTATVMICDWQIVQCFLDA
ncbi:hypothetical protein GmHk_19G054085 [Glycine max]|nr:hypothetical protein GmHk_19G054085 [Glycine max]